MNDLSQLFCFLGFFSFGILCWETLSRRKPFEGIYCSCQTLCCPHLVHKFPYCSDTVFSNVPLPSLTVTAQSSTLEDVNIAIPHQILCFQRSCSFWREKAELLPPLVSQSVLAEALSMSWVFHVPSVRRNITSYLSAGILKSVTSIYEWAEYSFLQLLWDLNTNPEMLVHDGLS